MVSALSSQVTSQQCLHLTATLPSPDGAGLTVDHPLVVRKRERHMEAESMYRLTPVNTDALVSWNIAN